MFRDIDRHWWLSLNGNLVRSATVSLGAFTAVAVTRSNSTASCKFMALVPRRILEFRVERELHEVRLHFATYPRVGTVAR